MFNKLLTLILLSSMGISAYANGASTPPQQGISSMIIMFALFIAIFYFLLIRPQQKRAKEQKSLLDSISIGDEVVTAGGIVGRITKLKDNFVKLAIAEGVELTLQKSSVNTILPKGTVSFSD